MHVYLYYFIIYSFIGWCIEVCYATLNTGKFVNRGFLNGPYCPIYGSGATAMVYFLSQYKEFPLILFVTSAVIATILEFITGYILEKIFNCKWWDYSNVPFNIKGYICLKFTIIWGLASILLINVLHPIIRNFISHTPRIIGRTLMFIMFTTMLADFIVTVKTILKLNVKLKNLEKISSDALQFSDNFGNKLSENFLATQEKFKSLRKRNWFEKRLLISFPHLRSKKFRKPFARLKVYLYKKNKEKNRLNTNSDITKNIDTSKD
ncbi:putative ABC transporter permease [Fusobacterium sp. PH5-44]|uniref:putative ABC transporter permease n=1 Tax=unclassified Fusobacterium TaxID=2648384 RepID=UPI003D224D5A